jgi:DNA-binding CsgD family transcriptional regulator
MAMLKGGIFISAKEISLLNGCHIRTAYDHLKHVRDALAIQGKKLTVKQYCEYEGIALEVAIELLNQYR